MVVALLVLIFLAIIFPGFFRFVIGGLAFLLLAAIVFAPAHAEPTEGEKKGMVMPDVIALSDCIAFQVIQSADQDISPSTLGPMLNAAIGKCEPFKQRMISYYDSLFSPGEGQAFFDGPYRKDLTRAVMQRINSGSIKQPSQPTSDRATHMISSSNIPSEAHPAHRRLDSTEFEYKECVVNHAVWDVVRNKQSIDSAIEEGFKLCHYRGQNIRLGQEFKDIVIEDTQRGIAEQAKADSRFVENNPPQEFEGAPEDEVSSILQCNAKTDSDALDCKKDDRYLKVWLKTEDDLGRLYWINMRSIARNSGTASATVVLGVPGQPRYLWTWVDMQTNCSGYVQMSGALNASGWMPPKSIWSAVASIVCSRDLDGRIVTVSHWPWESSVNR